MTAAPTPGLPSGGGTPAQRSPGRHGAEGATHLLSVASIGALVPAEGFDGTLHSVFAHSCNIASGGLLLNLCAPVPGHERGPATLRLSGPTARPMHELFDVGERWVCRGGVARTRRARVVLARAVVWRPPVAGIRLGAGELARNLGLASAALQAHRAARPNVLDREACATVAALAQACRRRDADAAAAQARRLVGWGEGLTPAGDDFLVGLLAGLDFMLRVRPANQGVRAGLAAAVASAVERTNDIGAQALRLAVAGHRGEALSRLCDALLGDPHGGALRDAMRGLLQVGASSGADTALGLLAGVVAGLEAGTAAEGHEP